MRTRLFSLALLTLIVLAPLACTRSASGVASTSGRATASAPDVPLAPSVAQVATVATGAPVTKKAARKHRAVANACPHARGAGKSNWGRKEDCKSDAACKDGLNGRCLQIGLGAYCSYDDCYADKDCQKDSAGSVCDCRESGAAPYANRCVAGNCKVDADCNGWSCSPTLGPMGRVNGVVGYYCHGPNDLCIDDEDCAGSATCRYEATTSRFQCSASEVHPG